MSDQDLTEFDLSIEEEKKQISSEEQEFQDWGDMCTSCQNMKDAIDLIMMFEC